MLTETLHIEHIARMWQPRNEQLTIRELFALPFFVEKPAVEEEDAAVFQLQVILRWLIVHGPHFHRVAHANAPFFDLSSFTIHGEALALFVGVAMTLAMIPIADIDEAQKHTDHE